MIKSLSPHNLQDVLMSSIDTDSSRRSRHIQYKKKHLENADPHEQVRRHTHPVAELHPASLDSLSVGGGHPSSAGLSYH